MVRISTYRDERKLFALIAAVIVAATIALVQISAGGAGRPSPVEAVVSTALLVPQRTLTAVVNAGRTAVATIAEMPNLVRDNAALRARVGMLEGENGRMTEMLAVRPDLLANERLARSEPRSVPAQIIGYDPENTARIGTIDRGADAHFTPAAGVLAEGGVAGRLLDVKPFTSTVLFVTDAASEIPAIVQRGRWWGIAQGTSTSISLRYISQDAKLRIGDVVVTGAGRSFRAGYPLGRIARISHPAGALYQSAILEPAVAFGRLDRVLVLGR